MNEKRLVELFDKDFPDKKQLIRLYLHLQSLLHSVNQFLELFNLLFDVAKQDTDTEGGEQQKNTDKIRNKLEELEKQNIHYLLLGTAYAFIGELLTLFSESTCEKNGEVKKILNVFCEYPTYENILLQQEKLRTVHYNLISLFSDKTIVDLRYIRDKVIFHRDEKTIKAYINFLSYQKIHDYERLDTERITIHNIVDVGMTRSCFKDLEGEQLFALLGSDSEDNKQLLSSRLQLLVRKGREISDCVKELCLELEKTFE